MTATAPIEVRHSIHRLRPDPGRVIAKLFVPGQEGLIEGESRAQSVIDRILALDEDQATAALDEVGALFADRHHDLPGVLTEHFGLAIRHVALPAGLSSTRQQLIGAYFTQEYAVEAAAVCNPSIVAHPDQAGMGHGEARFVMSLRAIGEGHHSSIEFRTGQIFSDADIRFDKPGAHLFGAQTEWVAASSYEAVFPSLSSVSQRVLSPFAPTESHGMEDARFVRVDDHDGAATYYATYTAYDGTHVTPRLLTTADFRTFVSTQLTGRAARNKGMALFPRRIGGCYYALSRWDRETNAVVTSHDPTVWNDSVSLPLSGEPWNLVQMGNCGSPIETPAGWIVLTHGVGPMRRYAIGADLLDIDDPTRVIGHLAEPLAVPADDERDGYVPNVVYSCGAMRHGDNIVLPYGMGDANIGVAIVPLDQLLDRLTAGSSPS